VNHLLTANLVQACIQAAPHLKRFVYVSSIAAAGPSPPDRHMTESDRDEPRSEYGRTKLAGEKCVIQARDSLPITIIRPPNVFGPRQKETEQLIRLIRKRLVPDLGSHQPITSLIYVTDLIQGILAAIQTERSIGETYYLTDGQSYAWRHILLALKQELLKESWSIRIPERVIYLAASLTDLLKKTRLVRSYFGRRAWQAMATTPWLFSSDKAREHFGFSSSYSLEQGMRETVQDVQKRKSLCKSSFLL
jgi:nucleoside-diphosphate-sugar epimerase